MKNCLCCLLLALLCLLTLSGCSVILDISTDIHKNGSGTVSFLTGADRELYENLTEMDSSFSTELEELPYNGETVFGTVLSVDFSSPEELTLLLTDENALNKSFPGLDSDTPLFDSVTVSPKGISGKVNLAFFREAGDDAAEYGVEITGCISFTFPGIVKTANGTVSEDGHTVSWDIADSDDELFAEVRGVFPTGLAILLFVVILLVAAVLILLNKRSRKKQETFAEEPAESEAPSPEAQVIPDDVWHSVLVSGDVPCPGCGTFNAAGNNFCTGCGTKLEKAE